MAFALGSNLWVAVYKLSCFFFELFWVANFEVFKVKIDASEIGEVPAPYLFIYSVFSMLDLMRDYGFNIYSLWDGYELWILSAKSEIILFLKSLPWFSFLFELSMFDDYLTPMIFGGCI